MPTAIRSSLLFLFGAALLAPNFLFSQFYTNSFSSDEELWTVQALNDQEILVSGRLSRFRMNAPEFEDAQPFFFLFNKEDKVFQDVSATFPDSLKGIMKIIPEGETLRCLALNYMNQDSPNLAIIEVDADLEIVSSNLIQALAFPGRLGNVYFEKWKEMYVCSVGVIDEGGKIIENRIIWFEANGEIIAEKILSNIHGYSAWWFTSLMVHPNQDIYFSINGFNRPESIFKVSTSLDTQMVYQFPPYSSPTPEENGQHWMNATNLVYNQGNFQMPIRHREWSWDGNFDEHYGTIVTFDSAFSVINYQDLGIPNEQDFMFGEVLDSINNHFYAFGVAKYSNDPFEMGGLPNYVWVSSVDQEGELNWESSFYGEGYLQPNELVVGSENIYLFGQWFSEGETQNRDPFVLIFEKDGTLVGFRSTVGEKSTWFPNPSSNGQFTFLNNGLRIQQMVVHNYLGQELIHFAGANVPITLNLSPYGSGVYFVKWKLFNGGGYRSKLVVE